MDDPKLDATSCRVAGPDEIFGTDFWRDPFQRPDDRRFRPIDGPERCVFFANAVERVAAHAPKPLTGNAARFWAAKVIVDARIAGNLVLGFVFDDLGFDDDTSTEQWLRWRSRGELPNLFANCGMQAADSTWARLFVEGVGLERLVEKATRFAAPRDDGAASVLDLPAHRPRTERQKATAWLAEHSPDGPPPNIKKAAGKADVSARTMARALADRATGRR